MLPYASIIDAAGIIAAFLPFSAVTELALESRPVPPGSRGTGVGILLTEFSVSALVFLFSAIVAAVLSEDASIVLLAIGFAIIVAMFLYVLIYLRANLALTLASAGGGAPPGTVRLTPTPPPQ